MTANEILVELRSKGQESYRKVLRNHGVPEPMFGTKIEEMKKIQKRIKMDYQVALDLFDSKIYDAQYCAGLIADDMKMTKKDLQHWADTAVAGGISEYTVPWVAAEGRFGSDMARKWIESKKESIATSGWATFSSLAAIKEDADLDMAELKQLLQRVQKTIHDQPNRVRYVMNGFVIAVGGYVASLSDIALKTGEKIGEVFIDMGDTACKTPYAPEYIEKMKKRGTLGKKRKSAKC